MRGLYVILREILSLPVIMLLSLDVKQIYESLSSNRKKSTFIV